MNPPAQRTGQKGDVDGAREAVCTRLSGCAVLCAIAVVFGATGCGNPQSLTDAGVEDPPTGTPLGDSGTAEPDAGTGLFPGMMCAVLPNRVICPSAQTFWTDAGSGARLFGLATNSGGGSTTTMSVSFNVPAAGTFMAPISGSISYSLTRCDAGSCYAVCQLSAAGDAGFAAAGTAYRTSPSVDFFLKSNEPADGGDCAGPFEIRANFVRPKDSPRNPESRNANPLRCPSNSVRTIAAKRG